MHRIKYKRSKCRQNQEGNHWGQERPQPQSNNICPTIKIYIHSSNWYYTHKKTHTQT